MSAKSLDPFEVTLGASMVHVEKLTISYTDEKGMHQIQDVPIRSTMVVGDTLNLALKWNGTFVR